jgi:hypothetical protein
MPDLALRLEARRIGRAVRASGTQLRRVQDHAWLLAFVGMAGEHAAIHAAHVGPLAGPRTFHFCPDPRDLDIRAQLLCEIADRLEGYLDWCATCDEAPQLFVTSPAAIGKLDSLADRLPYTPVDRAATKAIQDRQRRLRRFGGQLVYLTRREPHAGQQVLLAATALLSEHFVTGQDDQEDIHLGAQLAWVDPRAGIDPVTAAEIAERTPMGAITDPEFDADVLIHDVAAYNDARRNGAPAPRVKSLADVVGRRLEPVTIAMAEGIERAVGLVAALGLPELPGVDEFVERDREAFPSHRGYVAGGGGIPLADRPKGAAFEYLNREDAEQQWAAAVLHGDPVHRALARLRGT